MKRKTNPDYWPEHLRPIFKEVGRAMTGSASPRRFWDELIFGRLFRGMRYRSSTIAAKQQALAATTMSSK
jgi:hypothetical protein